MRLGRILSFFVVAVLMITSVASQEKSRPEIEPRAREILRNLNDYLAQAREFGFEVVETIDEIQDTGFLLQYSNLRRIGIRRPNRMVVDVSGDTLNRTAWYDGSTLSLFDKQHNLYSRMETPATLNETFDELAERYEVVLPLADLLSENFIEKILEQVELGFYVGLHNVERWKCHHLAFSQPFVDWQIWIEAGAKPIPRKLVITHKEIPGAPQHTSLIRNWREPLPLPDSTFHFIPPEGAEEVAMPTMVPLRDKDSDDDGTSSPRR